MDALLFICHGSRIKKAQEQAIVFIKKCMEDSHVPIKEYCFLELASPSIEEGFIRCINQGATRITAVPVLLLTAAHAKEDIPEKLGELSRKYPEAAVKYGRPIGVHEKMIDILIEKIEETGEKPDKESMILLVGRGSSDPDVKKDLETIAGLLGRRTGVKTVQTCFLAAASPSLEEGIKIAAESDCQKIFVIPYLLFTGVLMNKLQKVIKPQEQGMKFILCNYLGYHPEIELIMQERVKEALPLKTKNRFSSI